MNKPMDEAALSGVVEEVCSGFDNREDALLEILHGLQARLGYVPEAAIQPVATALNLSRAEVHGVVSFYHDFLRAPPGRHVIKLCRAECCQANGSDALARHAEEKLGIAFGETSKDGAYSLKAVYCLGNCSLGPSVLIGETLYGRVDGARFDAIIKSLDKD